MAIKLEKSKPINLEKSVNKMKIGLGWEVLPGNELDLDVSVVAVTSSGKVQNDQDLCYYNNLDPYGNKALWSEGDDRTGGNSEEGDDEVVHVDFSKLPAHVEKLHVLVTIHEATKRNHHFGLLQDAYAKIYNGETGEELYFIDLDEEASGKTAVHVATIAKSGDVWSVEKVDSASKEDLGQVIAKFGL